MSLFRSSLALIAAAALAAGAARATSREQTSVPFPPPIDPQRVQDQDDMTWADYRPIPGTNWGDPRIAAGERALKVALIAIDFEDQPFVITQPKGSDPFGNPQVDPVPRADVAQFYADFWGMPGPLNHGHTIHEYWMEQSRGKVGIPKIDVFGPYRMPRKLFEYGLNEYNQASGMPDRLHLRRPHGARRRRALARRRRRRRSSTAIRSSSASTPATTRRRCGRNSAR